MRTTGLAGSLRPYVELLGAFTEREITGEAFEVRFLTLYKNDPTDWPDEIFEILDSLFADVDEFVVDPALREQVGGLDEYRLRERATLTLRKIRALIGDR